MRSVVTIIEIAIFFKLWEIEAAIFTKILTLYCATFKLNIQRPCNMQSARLLYNSDSHIAFERKKNILLCVSVIRDCYYLPHCQMSQIQFLFTNELSASGIVVLCSEQIYKR